METRTVEQVESWSTRSFADGFAGLRELSDGEFSGAVRANGAWLFMLNGRIIGVSEGTLDDFEDADGTAYAAPHPSLPLLFSMQEQGGDTRAKYYTNDTPLTEVDSTLSSGKFTGFVELSENVLSGDYYVAYYGGRSMSVAFVGASDQIVTGDDAFERAADEVGIYEVTDVDLEVTDVPEPEGSDEPDEGPDATSNEPTDRSSSTPSGGTSSSASTGGTSGVSSGSSASAPSGDSVDEATEAGTADGPGGETGKIASQPTASESPANETPAGGPTDGAPATESRASSTGDSDGGRSATDAIREPEAESGATEPERTTDAGRTTEASAGAATDSTPAKSTPTESESTASAKTTSPETTDAAATRDDAAATRDDASERTESEDAESDPSDDEADAFSEEAEWRETTTIPSLDPDRSEGPDEDGSRQGSTSNGSASTGTASTGTTSAGATSKQATSDTSAKRTADADSATSGPTQTGERASAKRQSGGQTANSSAKKSAKSSTSAGSETSGAGNSGAAGESRSNGDSGGADGDARARIQKLRSQLKQRKQQVQQLKERLAKVESERDEFEREREALRQEVERLEAKLETASSGGSSADGRQLSSEQAFEGTNLFVRYESKGKATLEEAAAGEADPEDVNANLRLEHHTQFETDGATVEGRAFEEFLTDSFEHRFVSWIIEDLLYEIRDTGHQSSLQDLYESIPDIDRIDLHGSVSAGGEEDDTRKESFDVIARDRMGNPLLVADLNDSRDPTTGDMMGSLVDAASGVGEAHDELSGAFQVTESFFEPEALETADTATTGGFLSREKRESFVKLSRKRGYHLCLVESRSGGFHLNVPEL